jgi:hypothetical protein
MEIKVFYKQNFGTDYCYPSCGKAKAFAKLIERKTFSQRKLKEIEELGYTITVVAYNPGYPGFELTA